MFLKDVGKAPEQIFAHFGEEPIGAASLAQVHYAILQTGEEVAVKVQKTNRFEELLTCSALPLGPIPECRVCVQERHQGDRTGVQVYQVGA